MRILQTLIIMFTVIGLGTTTLIFLNKPSQQQTDTKNNSLTALDSILRADSICVICVRCGYPNGRSLLWVKDSAKSLSSARFLHPFTILGH